MATKIKTIKELEGMINDFIELQEQIKNLEAEVDDIKDQIKGYMGDDEELSVGDHIVRWTKCSSHRFDSTSFKVSHPKLYKEFTKLIESRRFSISEG